MAELRKTLSKVERPRLLIDAARRGLAHYRRDRDLAPILRSARISPNPATELLEMEQTCEDERRDGKHAYSVSRHIAVLTALMSEAGALPA